MKKPPPITELYRYPISAGVCLLAVFVTAVDATGRSIAKLLMSVRAFENEPYRLVSSALPHGNALHLIFNVVWVWTLGTLLEDRFGALRLLALMLLYAAGSEAAEYAFFRGGIGLSGVVYGLYGLVYVLSRTDTKLRGVADARTTQLFVGWFFFCIAADVSGLMPIANVAHGVGAILGLLTGLAIAGSLRPNAKKAPIQALSAILLVLVTLGSVLGAARFRARINLAKDGTRDIADLGDEALDQGAYNEAIRRYRQALAIRPNIKRNWYNLGVAQWKNEDIEGAAESFAQAFTLAPEDPRYKTAVLDAKRRLAYEAEKKGDNEKAARLYEEALAGRNEDADTHYALGLVYQRMGRAEDAQRERQRAIELNPTLGRQEPDEAQEPNPKENPIP